VLVLALACCPTIAVAAPAHELSLDEKIGQMFILGFNGTSVSTEAAKLIQELHVGGLYLQGKNVRDTTQVTALVNSLKAENRSQALPLFLGVDQEGGRVNRLPAALGRVPSARIVGSTMRDESWLQAGDLLAGQLNVVGLNMDFAPVADLDDGPASLAIGDRSFGGKTDIVARAAPLVMMGLRMNNIIPVVKHFPGHGNTRTDSHVSYPILRKSQAQLEASDLIPFVAAIECGAPAVMVGHIMLPELDPLDPASLSAAITTGLLRGRLGFTGVIMTDDLAMKPVRRQYEMGEATVRAVRAGADIIMISGELKDQLLAIAALRNAVISGSIPVSRIDASVQRITELKQGFFLNDEDTSADDSDALRERITEFATHR
jgi:beta-N-acetylhexosaminidase